MTYYDHRPRALDPATPHQPSVIPYRKARTEGCGGNRGLLHVWKTVEIRDRRGWTHFSFRCVQCDRKAWRGHMACPECFVPFREWNQWWKLPREFNEHGRWDYYYHVCGHCGWDEYTGTKQHPPHAVRVWRRGYKA